MTTLLGDWARGGDPLNEQLAASIARAIDRGDLATGSRLPAERELAGELGLSRTTIVLAYGRLRDAGLVRSRQGSGTRVIGRDQSTDSAPGLIQPYVAPRRTSRRTGQSGAFWRPAAGDPTDVIEMTVGALPAPPIVLEAVTAAVEEDLPGLLGDAGYRPFGLPGLCDEIAALFEELGVPTDPDQVIVTSGAQQAVEFAAQELVGHEGVAALENPTYLGAIDALRGIGARMLPLPSDDSGLQVDLAAIALQSAPVQALFVVPTYHNPTGTILPEARRRDLARLAADAGIFIVEDLTPDLGLGRNVPPPIAAFDRAERVVTIGSLSKVAWGGLRVGWMRVPPGLVWPLQSRKIVADHGTSTLSQAVARRVLQRRGELARHAVAEAASRRAVVGAALRERLPEWEWREPAGGLSTWLRLPGADAGTFARIAAEQGVVVRPGQLFSPDGGYRDHIRIAIGEQPDRLREGVARLAAAWQQSHDFVRRDRPALSLSV